MTKSTIYNDGYSNLANIDWDFKSANVDVLSSIHPYPARFINEIPRSLIEALKCPENTAVLDPFCGSGTTLVEAQRKGLRSIGIDLNPIACLISRVKLSILPSEFLDVAETVCDKAMKSIFKDIEIPAIPNLDHWFKKDVQKALASILMQIESTPEGATQDALKLALSSIIVRVSNQESDTRYAAIEKNRTAKDVFSNFINASKRIFDAKQDIVSNVQSDVIEGDILKVEPKTISCPIGLVITSPPYPNAYEYWLYHKYRMRWLGFDPINVRTYEIGARPHYMKKNGQTEVDFFNQMDKVFDLICGCLISGGHICFVVGRSIIKGREINNGELITQIALKHNLELVADIEREISSTKKSFNLSYGKIKTENILIYKKGS